VTADAAIDATAAPSTADTAPLAPAGLLQIDAQPWGELVRLHDGAGAELPLPLDRSTPLALALPAGDYTAWLRAPQSSREERCTARLAAGGQALCTVRLRPLRAEDLLEELR
jgi:hypothetical protein